MEYKIQNSLFYIIYKLIVFLFFSFCGRKIRRKLALFYAKDCIMYLFYMVLYGKAESVFIVYFHVYTNKLRLFYYYDCINKCGSCVLCTLVCVTCSCSLLFIHLFHFISIISSSSCSSHGHSLYLKYNSLQCSTPLSSVSINPTQPYSFYQASVTG